MNKSFPTQVERQECPKCKSNAEYYCKTCKQDLCVPCKEEHVIDFDTKHHNVVIYRLKDGDMMLLETCERHPDVISEMWCLVCKLPFCSNCVEHSGHDVENIISVYNNQKKQHQGIIIHIKSEVMLHNRGIKAGINSDFKSCQTEISKFQKHMIIKAETLRNQILIVLEDVIKYTRVKLRCYLNSRLKQQRNYISSIQKLVHRSEQLENRVIPFLFFFKKTSIFKINDTPSTLIVKVHSPSDEINKDDVLSCLGGIQITETRKREVRNEQLLRMMSPPVLQKSFKVKSTLVRDTIRHISCVTSDRAWVSSWNSLKLTDTMGGNLFFLKDKCNKSGVHTVTRKGNLVYIDKYYNIMKLSLNNETKSTLMRIAAPWKPCCLYCSHLNGDFLIGMYKEDFWMMNPDKYIIKVARYNSKGQKLKHDPGQGLYINPRYITENQNGDVIVSDLINKVTELGTVVVTDSYGAHRFSYTGNPQGSVFRPQGICTDALSHILVCDIYTETVQMIDKDGHFLAVILTKKQGLECPYGLSYDHKSHLLWVGYMGYTTVRLYRHIQRHEHLTNN